MNKIDKPIILAICGKSATGKDTLAKFLTNFLNGDDIPTHNVISVTTRPCRQGEEHCKDYYFVNDNQFLKLVKDNKLIEYTCFRDWYYGVPYQEIQKDKINIGVFNPRGIRTLQKQHFKYSIIPIYLEEKFFVRMKRSHDREKKWRFEFVRRAIADFFEFRNIKKQLRTVNNGRVIMLKDHAGVWKQSLQIESSLINWGLLIPDGEKMRLGNFV